MLLIIIIMVRSLCCDINWFIVFFNVSLINTILGQKSIDRLFIVQSLFYSLSRIFRIKIPCGFLRSRPPCTAVWISTLPSCSRPCAMTKTELWEFCQSLSWFEYLEILWVRCWRCCSGFVKWFPNSFSLLLFLSFFVLFLSFQDFSWSSWIWPR